ncbi:MAG: hypothetical protein PVJ86_06500, partial [Phycisphaerales bacterium]
MRNKTLSILCFSVLPLASVASAMAGGAEDDPKVRAFVGQDLHLQGRELISYRLNTTEHVLVFQGGFSMSIGVHKISGDSAVVWLESATTEFRGRPRTDYETKVYLQGSVSVKKAEGTETTGLKQTMVEGDRGVVFRFSVSGEVFVTADKREIAD